MLRAGYLVSILEKLPYDMEVEFQMEVNPEATMYQTKDDISILLSDQERIVVRENGGKYFIGSLILTRR